MVLDDLRKLIEEEYELDDIAVEGTRYNKKFKYRIGLIEIQTEYDSDKDPAIEIYYKGNQEWDGAYHYAEQTTTEKKEILIEIFDTINQVIDKIYDSYADEIEAYEKNKSKVKLIEVKEEELKKEIVAKEAIVETNSDLSSTMTAGAKLAMASQAYELLIEIAISLFPVSLKDFIKKDNLLPQIIVGLILPAIIVFLCDFYEIPQKQDVRGACLLVLEAKTFEILNPILQKLDLKKLAN